MKKKIFSFCKKWARRVALAALVFHGATQLNYWRNDIQNAIDPSPLRSEFYDEFGISLRGWKADIEENPAKIAEIAEAVSREKQDDGFNLKSIRVESNNYLKRSFLNQLEDLITTGYGGWYFSKRIGLTNHVDVKTTLHEIKHAKTFAIAKKHPELLEKWLELAEDENGKSLYRGNFVTFCKRIRGIERLFRDEKDSQENQRLGFISDYARSNVYEDIAELTSAAEPFPTGLYLYIYGSQANPRSEAIPTNEIIVAKLKLAEYYGLIPRGFFEHSELDILFEVAEGVEYNIYKNKDHIKAVDFFKRVEDFFKRHPDSSYECELKRKRGRLLEHMGVAEVCLEDKRLWDLRDEKKDLPESALEDIVRYEKELFRQNKSSLVYHLKFAIEEYKSALESKFKDSFNYYATLGHIANCYRLLDEERNSKIYEQAIDEYTRRKRNIDLKLSSSGVNDYIGLLGEL